MARITGGEVTYMERRKIGDYEHKEAKAVLSFSLDDGDDHDSTLDTLTAAAKARVHEMLGLVGKAIPTPSTPIETPVKRGPGRPTNAELAAQGKLTKPPKVNAPAPAPAAEAPVAEAPKAPPVLEAPAVTALSKTTVEDPIAVVEATIDPDLESFTIDEPTPEIKKIVPDPVTEVTDAMLQSEVTKVMKKINNAIAIKDVIRKSLADAGITNPTGKQLRDIPMTHRPAFIAQIGAL